YAIVDSCCSYFYSTHQALHSFPTRRSSDLIAQARATLETAGIKVQASAALAAQELGSAQEGVLALVIREAVTNILRHSQATECEDRKSTRLNSSHRTISYAVFCLKKKKKIN